LLNEAEYDVKNYVMSNSIIVLLFFQKHFQTDYPKDSILSVFQSKIEMIAFDGIFLKLYFFLNNNQYIELTFISWKTKNFDIPYLINSVLGILYSVHFPLSDISGFPKKKW